VVLRFPFVKGLPVARSFTVARNNWEKDQMKTCLTSSMNKKGAEVTTRKTSGIVGDAAPQNRMVNPMKRKGMAADGMNVWSEKEI
jgi:hypothetical protein